MTLLDVVWRFFCKKQDTKVYGITYGVAMPPPISRRVTSTSTETPIYTATIPSLNAPCLYKDTAKHRP